MLIVLCCALETPSCALMWILKWISEGTLEINLLPFALMLAAGLQQHTNYDWQTSEVLNAVGFGYKLRCTCA